MTSSDRRHLQFAAMSLFVGLVSALPLATELAAGDARLEALKDAYRRPAEIPFPTDNPYTPEKAALGKALFFDPRLSGAENMNCASCHNPSFGWEVPVKTAVGAMNQRLSRQAPTVENSAWGHSFFWDGRAPTLEAQARGPIEAPVEMNLPVAEAVERLDKVADYKKWFKVAFPDDGLTEQTLLKAIATYQRTIVSGTSPFDEWTEGREDAISESAKRGFGLFNGKARCADCHSGWRFTDEKFHDIGITSDDTGRGAIEPDNVLAKFAFKTPGLRDIGLRGPFMHNGDLETLLDVLIHYVGGGIERPSRSPLMGPIELDEQEIADLEEFLSSLTARKSVVDLPILPN